MGVSMNLLPLLKCFLTGVIGVFASHALRRQSMQFCIHQWQQFVRSLRFSSLNS